MQYEYKEEGERVNVQKYIRFAFADSAAAGRRLESSFDWKYEGSENKRLK